MKGKIIIVITFLMIGFIVYFSYSYNIAKNIKATVTEINNSLERDQGFIGNEIEADFTLLEHNYISYNKKYRRHSPYGDYFDEAIVVQKWSDTFVQYIQSVKSILLNRYNLSYKTNNKDSTPKMVVNNENSIDSLAYNLKSMIGIYEEKINNFYENFSKIDSINRPGLSVRQMMEENFKNMPEVFDVVLLSTLQVNIKKTELKFLILDTKIADKATEKFIVEHPEIKRKDF